MARLIAICFAFILSFSLYSQTTAYIAAPSGLNMRKTASAQGTVVKKLPYTTKVLLVKEAVAKVAHKTKEAEGFYLNGYWQKIVVAKDTGYVFDAFLLPFEPVTVKELESYWYDTLNPCSPTEYNVLNVRFKKEGGLYNVEKWKPEDSLHIQGPSPLCVYKFSQKFAGGRIVIEHTESHTEEHDGGTTITFDGIDFNTVYAFILGHTTFENYQSEVTVALEDGSIIIGPDGAGCFSTITRKGTTIVWDVWCGC